MRHKTSLESAHKHQPDLEASCRVATVAMCVWRAFSSSRGDTRGGEGCRSGDSSENTLLGNWNQGGCCCLVHSSSEPSSSSCVGTNTHTHIYQHIHTCVTPLMSTGCSVASFELAGYTKIKLKLLSLLEVFASEINI